ncbi:MAG: LytTR family DNA-binding domain-containing protein [Bacteroidia bacterium]|nr:LytTR family DNA-binding domain-containing protein [Bacteroidia bacterium]
MMDRGKKYTCLIVDDDPMARKQLGHLIDKVDYLYLLEAIDKPLKALEVVKSQQLDLIFLDIEMPELSGFELAKHKQAGTGLIFTTSKKKYALEAFDMEAEDYLIKPILFPRFLQSVQKALKAHQFASPGIHHSYRDHLFLKENKRLIRTATSDIFYIESTGDYAKFFTENGMVVVHSTLKNILKLLDPSKFVKVHRSFVVNVQKIIDIEDNSLLIKDKIIPISRAQKSELMRLIQVI